MGSSHGLSRIIRLAYFEDPAYVPLVKRAYQLWRELEQESGMDILTITGCLDLAPRSRRQASGSHGLTCFEGSLLAARQHGLAHEVLTAQQLKGRFPAFRLPSEFQALFQPDGGILAPERGIKAHVAAAQQHGARIACSTKVLAWEPAEAPHPPGASGCIPSSGAGGSAMAGDGELGILLHTEGPEGERASYWARRVVMAPGPWLGKLVPEMQGLLQVERQVVGWFETLGARSQDYQLGRLPVFLLQDHHGYFYGFPADEHGLKVGKYHHRHEVVDPDTISRDVSPEDEHVLRECVDRFFPGAAGRLVRASACMFTNTPDGHFILDRHPRYPQVVLSSACSGHGFKFSPVVGAILADLALTGGTQHEIAFLRVSPGRTGHAEFLERCASGGGGGSAVLEGVP